MKDEESKHGRRLKITELRKKNAKDRWEILGNKPLADSVLSDGKSRTNPFSIDDGDEAFAQLMEQYKERKSVKGWKNFPLLCLRILAECPYIYDAIKLDVLRWECSSGNHRYIK